jgi:nitroimidazol reductase NimA-like FMN-containing flavoprotein (pyridoxamine 5'-phosphate oxidase superfamily)
MAVTITTEPKPILVLDLTSEEANRVEEAQRQGMDLATLFRDVIAKLPAAEVQPDEEKLHPGMTFAEILAPVHEHIRNMGYTDEEIGDFVDAEIRAYRAERRGKEAKEQQPDGRA